MRIFRLSSGEIRALVRIIPRCSRVLPRRRTASLALLISLLLSLGIIACSGPAPTATRTPAAAPSPAADRSAMLILGSVNNDAQKTVKDMQPLADYLAQHVSQAGIRAGAVRVAPDLDTMVKLLQTGDIDLTFDTPYRAMVFAEKTGARSVLRSWKSGDVQYRSVIFVRTDSGLNSISQLNGHTIGFESDFSTSGYFLPLTYMLDKGIKAVQVNKADASVPADHVGYFFTGDDNNTLDAVLNKRLAAGAFDEPSFNQLKPEARAQLKIVAETIYVPRELVIVRSNLPAALEQQITTVLTGMNQTDAGRKALKKFSDTTQFDAFDPTALQELTRFYALLPQR